MAISRETKEQQVTKLTDYFERSKLTVLVDYKGLSVAEMQELRRELKNADSSLQVVKNTLIRLASSKHAPFKEVDPKLFDGPTALAYGFSDEISVAQVLAKFAKTHSSLEIKAGVNGDGTLMSSAEVQQLASLPSKEHLLGQLVGTLAAPISGFARVLKGNINNLVYVMSAINQAKSA